MKTKELKNLAKKIAKAEIKIRNAKTPEEKAEAEAESMMLCGKVTNINDMLLVDDFVQEYLEDLI